MASVSKSTRTYYYTFPVDSSRPRIHRPGAVIPIQNKPKKLGRPALPKGRAKSGVIQVRLNAEDRKRVEMAAKKNKTTVSEWTRERILGVDMSAIELDKVIALLSKARNVYDQKGDLSKAQGCEDSIALIQNIFLQFAQWP